MPFSFRRSSLFPNNKNPGPVKPTHPTTSGPVKPTHSVSPIPLTRANIPLIRSSGGSINSPLIRSGSVSSPTHHYLTTSSTVVTSTSPFVGNSPKLGHIAPPRHHAVVSNLSSSQVPPRHHISSSHVGSPASRPNIGGIGSTASPQMSVPVPGSASRVRVPGSKYTPVRAEHFSTPPTYNITPNKIDSFVSPYQPELNLIQGAQVTNSTGNYAGSPYTGTFYSPYNTTTPVENTPEFQNNLNTTELTTTDQPEGCVVIKRNRRLTSSFRFRRSEALSLEHPSSVDGVEGHSRAAGNLATAATPGKKNLVTNSGNSVTNSGNSVTNSGNLATTLGNKPTGDKVIPVMRTSSDSSYTCGQDQMSHGTRDDMSVPGKDHHHHPLTRRITIGNLPSPNNFAVGGNSGTDDISRNFAHSGTVDTANNFAVNQEKPGNRLGRRISMSHNTVTSYHGNS
eukprot:sb/3464613/